MKNYSKPSFRTTITPATPDPGFWRFYAKSDGFYQLDDAGVETKMVSAFVVNTTNYIPKSNGVALIDSLIFDDGTNVGIGTITPVTKLNVVGSFQSEINFGAGNYATFDTISYVGFDDKNYISVNEGNIGRTSVYGLTTKIGSKWSTNASVNPSYILFDKVEGPGTIVGKMHLRVDRNTAGSVITLGSEYLVPARSLYVDVDNNYTGFNYDAPSAIIHARGRTADAYEFGLKVDDYTSSNNFIVRNDGYVGSKRGYWVNEYGTATAFRAMQGDNISPANIFLGYYNYDANPNNTGSIVIALGSNAAYNNTGSNVLMLGQYAGLNNTMSNVAIFGESATGGVVGYLDYYLGTGPKRVSETIHYTNLRQGTAAVGQTDKDMSAATFNIIGSVGTGTGLGGSIILKVAPASVTGSTQNTLVNALELKQSGYALFNGTIDLIGFNNTLFLGNGAGNTVGSLTNDHNIGIGRSTLASLNGGYQNVGVGSNVFQSVVGGGGNVGMGYVVGFNTTGSANTLIGYGSMYTSTTGSGNSYLGSQTGANGNGDFNIFLGYYAGSYETGSNTLIIDSVNRVTETASRNGALIYGISSFVASTQTLTFNASVGIGTLTPTARLDVQGTTGSGEKLLSLYSTDWATPSEQERFYLTQGAFYARANTYDLHAAGAGDATFTVYGSANGTIKIWSDAAGADTFRVIGGNMPTISSVNSGLMATDANWMFGSTTVQPLCSVHILNGAGGLLVGNSTGGAFANAAAFGLGGTYGIIGFKNNTDVNSIGNWLWQIREDGGAGAAQFWNSGVVLASINTRAGQNRFYCVSDVGSVEWGIVGTNGLMIQRGYSNFGYNLGDAMVDITGDTADSSAYGLKVRDAFQVNLNFSVRNDGQVSSRLGYSIGGNNALHEDGTSVRVGNTLMLLTAGYGNTSLGYLALNSISAANANTALGMNAGLSIGIGSSNTLIGFGAGDTITSGAYNISIGADSLGITTGSANIGIGFNTLNSNTTQNFNTAIGHNALTSNTGSASIALGYFAGFWETGSNKLFIDNAQRVDEADGRSKALVYGEFDAQPYLQRLTINGLTRIHNFTVADMALSSPFNGDITYVTDTDGTFTSKGFWGYEEGAWVKL